MLYDRPIFRNMGDRALLVELGDEISPSVNRRVRALFLLLERHRIEGLVEMVPGLSSIAGRFPDAVDDRKLKRIEAIILSMTPDERRRPDIIDGHRRRRIARGSGTTPQDVNQLLNQFRQTQKIMKQMARGKGIGSLKSMLR